MLAPGVSVRCRLQRRTCACEQSVSALASSVNALAFTSGRDIFFAEGQYAPTSTPGRQLPPTNWLMSYGGVRAIQVERGAAKGASGRCAAPSEPRSARERGRLLLR